MKFKILKFKKVKSTNDTALRIIKKTNIKNGMIIADSQYKGRGQYGKKWISYKDETIIEMKKQLYSRLWMFRLYVLNKKGIENKKPACLLSLCAFDRDSDGPGVGELWRPRPRIRYI